MSKKIFFSLFLMIAVFGVWTCNKDDDKTDLCAGTWASELSDEANTMINAAQAYASNPTPATCNAYKQAAQAYVDALEPYGNCSALTGQDKVDWQNAVDDAQESLDALDCSM